MQHPRCVPLSPGNRLLSLWRHDGAKSVEWNPDQRALEEQNFEGWPCSFRSFEANVAVWVWQADRCGRNIEPSVGEVIWHEHVRDNVSIFLGLSRKQSECKRYPTKLPSLTESSTSSQCHSTFTHSKHSWELDVWLQINKRFIEKSTPLTCHPERCQTTADELTNDDEWWRLMTRGDGWWWMVVGIGKCWGVMVVSGEVDDGP